MDEATSISGQILALHDQGYSPDQITKEMASRRQRVGIGRVRATIRKSQSRSLDSQRIFAIYELCTEILSRLDKLEGKSGSVLRIEQELPRRMGRTLDRLTAPESR